MAVHLPRLGQQGLPEVADVVRAWRVAAACAAHPGLVAAQRLAHALVLPPGRSLASSTRRSLSRFWQRRETGAESATRPSALAHRRLRGAPAGMDWRDSPSTGEGIGVRRRAAADVRRRAGIAWPQRGHRRAGRAWRAGRCRARAHRHEAQVRQDAVARQLVVQRFQQGRVQRHQHLLELPEQ
ncbi:MAG: hypothetical protein IPF45_10340 [Thermomonas sp.]|nr:hypothetical protein [Thermomonas sp.]